MSKSLETIYRNYISAINARSNLSPFVHPSVTHNGNIMSCAGYMDMIKASFIAAPDLFFTVDKLVTSEDGETETIAARICFDVTPISTFLGLEATGRRVQFAEQVFYRLRDGKIDEVWSLIDTNLVKKQLEGPA
jgi:predicted ester cyclase